MNITRTQCDKTYLYVDNVMGVTRDFHEHIAAFVLHATPLPGIIGDLFEITILKGYNADGSDRGIVNWQD
ncbi:hypothetical protein [Thalassoglobus polymorphus]|uniref:Uncharacterized protein n=1 Tax=Thalassoglobus polymorphus TaxID=2527994 RepID=A0A517QH52_9PLAN|nr:hypothetical protein [Thalassoglobus polymorphus]QDT30913.1 hypothetical protein Mal48_01420 [Thalassoglobus polymorphus]QDT30958.1 hypothetical protein Mal48_01870 [Thalassoglobus polymorphus]